MRILVDLELQESELTHGPQVAMALQAVSDQVTTKVVTDKSALAAVLREAMLGKGLTSESAANDLVRRLSQPALRQDCLEVLCSTLFAPERIERNESSLPLLAAIARGLSDPLRTLVRDEILNACITFLAKPRRLDSARDALLPYADVVGCLVRSELLPIKNAVLSIIHMIRVDGTRCAGVTCLGKLVEIAHDWIQDRCDAPLLDMLRHALGAAQQDDTFLYDVEYITEPLGWNQAAHSNKFIHMGLVKTGLHHSSPIVALHYSGVPSVATASAREVVVTSSVDGTIATWDPQGKLIESCVLARHYAAALDLTRNGRALLAGGVGRVPSTNPAVVFYVEEKGRWVERGAVEPEGGRVITSVKSVRGGSSASPFVFCCGVHGNHTNTMCYCDGTRQGVIREYHEHSDVITTLFSPPDREHIMFSGSRDCTIVMYDLRMAQSAAQQFSHHYSTVTAMDGFGEYVITAGLDKRIMVHDQRMLHHPQNIVRDLDSAILSISVSPHFICAASTLTGITFVQLSQAGLPTCRAEPSASGACPRYHGVCWNATGSVLYAGGEGNTLDLIAQS